jgi:undecaprenyl-diphosphatase
VEGTGERSRHGGPVARPGGAAGAVLPGALRTPVAVVVALAAASFVVLAVRYHGVSTASGFDRWVDGLVPPPTGAARDRLVGVVDAVPPLATAAVVGVVAVLLLRRRWAPAAVAALGPALTWVLTEAGKQVVGRTLDGAGSLPSGHTSGAASAALVVLLLAVRRARRPQRAAALGLGAVLLVALGVALLMVAAQFHYPSDTVAGCCLSLATCPGVALAADRRRR